MIRYVLRKDSLAAMWSAGVKGARMEAGSHVTSEKNLGSRC